MITIRRGDSVSCAATALGEGCFRPESEDFVQKHGWEEILRNNWSAKATDYIERNTRSISTLWFIVRKKLKMNKKTRKEKDEKMKRTS